MELDHYFNDAHAKQNVALSGRPRQSAIILPWVDLVIVLDICMLRRMYFGAYVVQIGASKPTKKGSAKARCDARFVRGMQGYNDGTARPDIAMVRFEVLQNT